MGFCMCKWEQSMISKIPLKNMINGSTTETKVSSRVLPVSSCFWLCGSSNLIQINSANVVIQVKHVLYLN
jgi:hypothetical protein